MEILKEMENKRLRVWYSDHLYKRLDEAFDFKNIDIRPITKINNKVYHFDIIFDDDPVDVYVDFIQIKPEDVKLIPLLESAQTIYNVAYAIGDEAISTQFKKSSLKIFIPILKTIVECINDFIDDNDPDILMFFAAGKYNKELNDLQKMNVYRSIADKHLPTNYAITNQTFWNKDGFAAYNRPKFEGKNWKRK